MSKRNNNRKRVYRKGGERQIRVRGIRRDPPDTHRLARALLARAREMAAAQAEVDAAAQATTATQAADEREEARHDAN